MLTNLIVVRSFGPHAIGDLLTDAALIGDVLASEHAGYVVQMMPPKGPAPATPQPEA